MRATRILSYILSVMTVLPSLAFAGARTVTGLTATQRGGQTFLTWNNLPGVNWTYRAYACSSSVENAQSLYDGGEIMGEVGDSSAVDRRMSTLLGQILTFRTDSLATPLSPSRGLLVITPPTSRQRWYAVTAESAGRGEYLVFRPGENTLLEPLIEWLETPKPIFQRLVTWPVVFEDRVLFTSNIDRPDFPAMCSRMGWPTHLGIIRGIPGRPMTINGHGRGGSLINTIMTSGHYGDWALSFDEYLPNQDVASFYLGYAPSYDITKNDNPIAFEGPVERYSEKRVLFLLDWAKTALNYDPMRVYAQGGSMGGSFAFFFAYHHPDRIAAALSLIPKLVFNFQPEPPYQLRPSLDRMWGSVDQNLPLDNQVPVFDWMDGCKQAQSEAASASVPIFVFCGRNDTVVGWAEKVAYKQAMQQHRIGGTMYWDTRDHYLPNSISPWRPTQAFDMVYPYRLDRSFPALSNCTMDGSMGDGTAATGDSMGTINGFVSWDTTIVDLPAHWEVVLRLKDLPYRFGTFRTRDSATVDITPRRLQQFLVTSRVSYNYVVENLKDASILQFGVIDADSLGLLTIPGAPVLKSGVRVRLSPVTVAGIDDGPMPGLKAPRFSLSQHPIRSGSRLSVAWPNRSAARLEVYDLTGRRVKTLFTGATSGVQDYRLSADGIAPGVYMLSARQGDTKSSRRLVFVR